MIYQLRNMTEEQVKEFLREPRFAIVGTTRKSGGPQMTPVWYLHENDRIYLSTDVTGAKCRNLSRDNRICICVAAAHPDARAVMIYGSVELVPQDSAWTVDVNWRLTRRYYDSDEEAQVFIDAVPPGADRALVVVTPEKVIGEDWN
jgi:PPOX class probable F420-dependent enzyme